MRWKSHVRFGERAGETYQQKCWQRAPVRLHHAPWQRGQIENLNRQWRWWFPRGMDLGSVTEADVIHAASIINGQRRRSLNHQSPAALYASAAVQ